MVKKLALTDDKKMRSGVHPSDELGLDRLGLVRVVIGLGNPGVQYHGTRHNIGFMVLDKIAERLGLTWQRSGNAEWATVDGEMNRLTGEEGVRLPLLLCKPQTFMNKSGDVVETLTQQGIKPEELLVVHDELEKPLAYVGMRFGGSARGHNGLRSLMERWACSSLAMNHRLKGQHGVTAGPGEAPGFWRLRVGIGRPVESMDVGDYVLSKFSKDERLAIEGAIVKAVGMIVRS